LWQPEPAEHAAIKTEHGADPIAGEGEDEEAGSVADAAGGSAKVGSERRLPIRARRHEVVRSAAQETGAEPRHDVAAVVFKGNGRHRDADIGGEQVHQRIDIPDSRRERTPEGTLGVVRQEELPSPIGRRRRRPARALEGALTDSTVESSISATSVAGTGTSRKINAPLASRQDLQGG
jgi:hypothetical protein